MSTTTKTIYVDDEVVELLRTNIREDETMSDCIRRLIAEAEAKQAEAPATTE